MPQAARNEAVALPQEVQSAVVAWILAAIQHEALALLREAQSAVVVVPQDARRGVAALPRAVRYEAVVLLPVSVQW